MSVVAAYDCIHGNLVHLPAKAQAAGYTTGTPDICWTSADWSAHPRAIRICQDVAADDDTADILDVERGAATNDDCPHWYRRALANYNANKRPGQRWPAIYTSQSNITPVVNVFVGAGIASGPKLWVANWNLNDPQAIAEVASGGGPFPIIGIQWTSAAFYDLDVFSEAWLHAVSDAPDPKPATASTSTPGGR
jgi:hypothetical protein